MFMTNHSKRAWANLVKPFILLSALAFAACSAGEGEALPYDVAHPNKNPPKSSAIVRAALYIDTSLSNYMDALNTVWRYTVNPKTETANGGFAETAELPYFDYVVLSGGSIKLGTVTAYLEITDTLRGILNNRALLRPLQSRGIKILLGITGGAGGVSFGSLPDETDQIAFARQCFSLCQYYGLDGVEFYDTNAAGSSLNPYPEIGEVFFNGKEFIEITTSALSQYYWKEGAGYMTNMMSYLIEMFGASSTFQGDVPILQIEDTPILVREEGFGRFIPSAIPRYTFSTTMACLGYSINYDPGFVGESNLYFVSTRNFAPVVIDLSAIDSVLLQEYSERLGNDGDSRFGLVYYTGLGADTPEQRELLSITAREIFFSDVN
jgi:hypothetical protein